jgi:hypothetical protein
MRAPSESQSETHPSRRDSPTSGYIYISPDRSVRAGSSLLPRAASRGSRVNWASTCSLRDAVTRDDEAERVRPAR